MPLPLEFLVLLGDCYYLPHEEGPKAQLLFEQARDLISRPPTTWGDEAPTFRNKIASLRDPCFRLTELRNRPLFYALNRRVWELREELDLLDRYVAFKSAPRNENTAYVPDSHLPGTYRGGMVARLQRLLAPQTDGTIAPAQERGGEFSLSPAEGERAGVRGPDASSRPAIRTAERIVPSP